MRDSVGDARADLGGDPELLAQIARATDLRGQGGPRPRINSKVLIVDRGRAFLGRSAGANAVHPPDRTGDPRDSMRR